MALPSSLLCLRSRRRRRINRSLALKGSLGAPSTLLLRNNKDGRKRCKCARKVKRRAAENEREDTTMQCGEDRLTDAEKNYNTHTTLFTNLVVQNREKRTLN